MSAMDYYNENGLVGGEIPAGQECPFLKECGLRTDNCPSRERGNIRRNHGFSCAAARAFSLVKSNEKSKT